ncbi:MAG TPA: outer membrane protein assembly factor BamA [Desulfomonilaceae bacterium]|nr:outer membrane protein assembly factor BamA [Desulfomonilaceae bacterium]
MKRLLVIILGILFISAMSSAQSPKIKKILVFPFKAKDASEQVSGDLAAVLGAELSREGDVEILSGKAFAEAVQATKVDTARVARILTRVDGEIAIWGTLSKLQDGYSLEVSVMQRDKPQKPRFLSITGKNIEELVDRIKDLALQISNLSLDRLKIGEIKIEGNKRIQKDAILNKLDVKVGSAFHKSRLSDIIREIYSMGYFEDVQVKAEQTPKGEVNLQITLKERPSIKDIETEGNKVFTRDQILDTITTKSFSVVSLEKIQQDIAKIKKMYEKEGYYEPGVAYEIKELSPNEAKLIFKINEGTKSYLTDIELEGSKSVPQKDLKKIMNIKEKGWFWFLDDSGTFTRDKLEENRMRLMLYYLDKGFINVQVGAPQMDIHDGSVKVSYPIREGERFQVRKVNVDGDLILPEEQLLSVIQLKPKTWFSRSTVGDDIKALTKLYNNQGYAYADVEPRQVANEKHEFIDFTYHINKGQRVTIEKVDIAGNERTRDKIIRRALLINEGDLYNADKFEASKNTLEGMDFFEAVRLKTSPGSRPDLMNVTVEVMEKKTGSLAAGLGFSSQDGAMGNVNLKERNLLGLGIVVNAKSNISGRRNTFEGSLAYPWIFDIPLTVSLRGYKTLGRENQYTRDSDGFGLGFGFPLYGEWTASVGLARDSSKLSNFDQGFARSVANYYKTTGANPQKFLNMSENSVSVNIGRDTRNNAVIPTAGTKMSIGGRFAGFGADVTLNSYSGEAIYYQLLFWKFVMKFKTNATLLQEVGNEPIPFDRRTLLGGIQSVRGYRYGEIGPRDRYGNVIGGDRSLYSNLECLFPILESLKLNGVVFFDAGNAWNSADSPLFKELKAGFGAGIRWVSPMGPIRIEYGWKVSPEKGEDPGAFAFGMGQLF